MTRKQIIENYRNLYTTYSQEQEALAGLIKQYGMYRLVFFLVWIILVFLSTSWTWISFGVIFLTGMLIFGYLVGKHAKLHRRKAIVNRLVRINHEEEQAMEWNFSTLFNKRY